MRRASQSPLRFTLRPATLCLALIGCGAGDDTEGAVAPPPPPPPPAAVATVLLTPSTASVLAGTAVQITATLRDANGTELTGRTISWTSSDNAVATVSTSGVVTTLAPGVSTIAATSESQSGTALVEVADPARIPAFSRPFPAGIPYHTTNFHDHDVPRPFLDNGRKVTFWGEQINTTGYEGHEGYDWRMTSGTPVFAAAAGTVVAVSTPAFDCPLLSKTIPEGGSGVLILEHQLPGSVRVRTLYAHLSRKDVQLGAIVTAGQQIGLTGAEGCALFPHLHFSVIRMTQTRDGQPAAIDPYGWEGNGPDPWLAESDGAASLVLWKPNEAPELFARVTLELNAGGGTSFFGLTTIQSMGVNDDVNPNNEYVELARDPRFAPPTLSIAGATIRTNSGVVYTVPAGVSLTAANPMIRIYTGIGSNSSSTLYMQRTTPAYNNTHECVALLNSAGQNRGFYGWGTSC